MAKNTAVKPSTDLQTISRLLDISKLDTLYRDLYLRRAFELMEPMLSRAAYARTKESLASVGWVEQQLRAAVERGEWSRTRELTERVRALRASAAAGGESLRLAESLYEGAADVPIDPFSPGLHVFMNASTQKLQQWQDDAIGILSALERTESSNGAFYARRATDFRSLSIKAPEKRKEEKETAGPAQLQEEALSALDSGDLSRLDQAVKKLMERSAAKKPSGQSAEVRPAEELELGEDLLYSFSEKTLAAARRLGLAPAQTPSRRHLAYLIPHRWQPWFLKEESQQIAKDQIARLTYPSGTDRGRDAIEFYLLNPFITSGGTRYQVCLVVEDLLLEEFDEPDPGTEAPASSLITALGLQSRWGLSRIDIENALLMHGSRIVEEELSLDPESFRLIAVPPDIYTLLGPDRGWGQKEMWTHFDGYRVREGGKLQALAGGDKRFGGTYDVVSFNPGYTNSKVIARFAVVQRKRMTTWHRKVV